MKDSITTATETYHARMRRVLPYIEAHLDEDLTVDRLSDIAAFSKFHFHRQFTALFGIGVAKFIQLLRMKRAAYQLAFHNPSIMDIALASGYDGPEAFTRAFKKLIGQSPSEFRKQPTVGWEAAFAILAEIRSSHMKQDNRQVTVVDVKPTRVAVMEHRGDPALLGESIRKFIAWRKEMNLPPATHATYNILYVDPLTAPPEEYRIDICVATDKEIALNDAGIIAKIIPGGACAKMRHIGSNDGLRDSISFLYGEWLPESGREPRDFPLYCQRVSFFPAVAEHEAITDIFLPLK
jgi:AraC family transcriptional regulator